MEQSFFLHFIDPLKLEKPEIYYMLNAIILKENGKIDEAFDMLNDIKEEVSDKLDSPFHQFYVAFNMNNGRTDDAVRYMSEYYIKNPNPSWFKVIQHSEDDTSEELLRKIENVVGERRDLSKVNNFFNNGIIGLPVYSHITRISIDDILLFKQYPYSKIYISVGTIYKAMSDASSIDNKILVDSTALTLLSEVNALNLLDVFDEVLIPYSAVLLLKQRESSINGKKVRNILNYIKSSPYAKNISIEKNLKIKGTVMQFIPEDTLDCIALAENFSIPFLNTEVSASIEFKSNYLVDMNSLFFYLKKNKEELREVIANTIVNMKKLGLEFLSFDSDDMYRVYSKQGISGIKPFLKMGINADYRTFTSVYISFLLKVKNKKDTKEFELCAKEIIEYLDSYVGKTRYYMYWIIRKHPIVEEDFKMLIKKTSIKDILIKNALYNINARTIFDYMNIIKSYDFEKILDISTAFVGFIIQFVAMFKEDKSETIKYIDFIKRSILINDENDIDYILKYMKIVNEYRKDN